MKQFIQFLVIILDYKESALSYDISICKINKIVIDINNCTNYLTKITRVDMFTIKIITYFT